jgi:hypothetical protein
MQTKYRLVLLATMLFVLPKTGTAQKAEKFIPESLWKQMSVAMDDLDIYKIKADRLEKTLNKSVQANIRGFDFDEAKLREDLADFNGYRIELKGRIESIIDSLNLLSPAGKDLETILIWEIFIKGRFARISRMIIPVTPRILLKNFV